jgi:N-methylhydantoinase A
VGPQSAGANPGPICYGRGGTEPALSDALLVKGVLGEQIADGRVALDVAAARSGIERLARTLGLDADRVVEGVVEISQQNMANAVRSVSIWKGLDPRELTLVAFGGAGGMVAGPVARALDIPRVLVPVHPGNTCAMGLLMTDMQEDASVAYLAESRHADPEAINARLGELRETVTRTLAGQGVAREEVAFGHFADVRYHGQIHELSVPLDAYPVTAATLDALFARFEQMYVDIYTITLEDHVPELTSLRVTAVGAVPQYRLGEHTGGGAAEPKGTRSVLEAGEWRAVPIYDRYTLAAGTVLEGPAVLEEPGSTIWVASGMAAEIDRFGNAVVTTNLGLAGATAAGRSTAQEV